MGGKIKLWVEKSNCEYERPGLPNLARDREDYSVGPFIGETALAGEQTFFQRSSAWRTAFKMKMKSRGEPTSPSVATIASSFISSAVT